MDASGTSTAVKVIFNYILCFSDFGSRCASRRSESHVSFFFGAYSFCCVSFSPPDFVKSEKVEILIVFSFLITTFSLCVALPSAAARQQLLWATSKLQPTNVFMMLPRRRRCPVCLKKAFRQSAVLRPPGLKERIRKRTDTKHVLGLISKHFCLFYFHNVERMFIS